MSPLFVFISFDISKYTLHYCIFHLGNTLEHVFLFTSSRKNKYFHTDVYDCEYNVQKILKKCI